MSEVDDGGPDDFGERLLASKGRAPRGVLGDLAPREEVAAVIAAIDEDRASRTPEEVRARAAVLAAGLDPVRLLAEIRSAQARLVEIANRRAGAEVGDAPRGPTLEEFLAGLRTAWREGEVRPTAKPKAAPVRWWRTRADPFAGAWPQLRAWFDAEPDRTARELLERLVAGQDGGPGAAQLRTLQRRLKIWRAEKARDLVFGTREQGGEATRVGR